LSIIIAAVECSEEARILERKGHDPAGQRMTSQLQIIYIYIYKNSILNLTLDHIEPRPQSSRKMDHHLKLYPPAGNG
jgi:hypothetical protein